MHPIFARMSWAMLLAGCFAFGMMSDAIGDEAAGWTYHAAPNRSGNFITPLLTWERARALRLDPQFQPKISGHVYSQPLFWRASGASAAMLIVATEDDMVYALDSRTGAEVWQRSLGKPVSRSALPCGNISPLGVTGTPIIDPAAQAVYVDAMVDASGPRHLVFALSLKDGAVLQGWPVDVAARLKAIGETFDSAVQNERGALTILAGRLFVPFGGHFGDCGHYRGWVVGIPLGDPSNIATWRTRAEGGGVWAPGGISSDGTSLFVATGNTFGASTWSDGEAIFRLSANLRTSSEPRDYFAPANWKELDRRDADLGGTNPVLFDIPSPSGIENFVLALGKDGHAYLLDRNNLGGIGGSIVEQVVSPDPIRTAPATYPATDGVFVAFQGRGSNCPTHNNANALTVLKIRGGERPGIATSWCGVFRGAGSPIVTTTDGRANPIVWVLGAEGDSRLHGFRGDTGEPLFEGGIRSEVLFGLRHFQSLLATEDRIYAAADGRVYAFSF